MKKISQDDKMELLFLLRRCGHFLYHRRGGKTGQNRILHILAREHTMTQKELQERVQVKSGTISETIHKLETAGLVTRSQNPDDKRQVLISLTPEGAIEQERIHQETMEADLHLFDGLTSDELLSLTDHLYKLLASWEAQTGESLLQRQEGHHHETHA